MKTNDFSSIVKQYRVIFFDAYGVIKNAHGLIPGVIDTFSFLKENQIEYFVLTNDASRGPIDLAIDYHKHGLTAIDAGKIISSGMLAREYLLYKVKQGTLAYLGTQASAHYIEAIGLKTLSIKDVNVDDSEHISALVLLDDEGFDWNHDINKVINLLRKRNIPVIIANTDKRYPVSQEHVAIAIGAVADMIERVVGKTFIRFGKPDSQMFHFAYEHVLQTVHVRKDQILMVGDTLTTDIIGGNKFGIDTMLVLSGNTQPEKARLLIRTTGIIPNFICHSIAVEPDGIA
ncbi:MAG: TIGR01459 family HAD-type hydrolase [Saprospiraceae bacterium]|nr:TIGR01459 family HAD-type hydrolase [Saprospiraceae bacterium]